MSHDDPKKPRATPRPARARSRPRPRGARAERPARPGPSARRRGPGGAGVVRGCVLASASRRRRLARARRSARGHARHRRVAATSARPRSCSRPGLPRGAPPDHRQQQGAGKIVELAVAESERVAAGELIRAPRERRVARTLSLAEAEYADATRELARAESLRGRGAASQAALDRALTQQRWRARAATVAQVAQGNREIRAPTTARDPRIRDVGRVSDDRRQRRGRFRARAVVTLADLSAIEVESRGRAEIRKVKLGGIALVTPEAMPRSRYLAA